MYIRYVHTSIEQGCVYAPTESIFIGVHMVPIQLHPRSLAHPCPVRIRAPGSRSPAPLPALSVYREQRLSQKHDPACSQVGRYTYLPNVQPVNSFVGWRTSYMLCTSLVL